MMIDLAWLLLLVVVIVLGIGAVRWLYAKSKVKFAFAVLGIMVLIVPLRIGLVWGLYTQAEPFKATLPYVLKSNVQKELPLFFKTKTSESTFNPRVRQFFVLYKVGCPYCNVAHEEIQKMRWNSKEKKSVHYVETSTPLGKKLVKKYNIKKAATMIVTTPDKKEAQLYKEAFAQTLPSGKTIYQPDKISIQQAFESFTEK
jgi:hypothetical protein